MHILRLDFEGGVRLDFGYIDRATAEACKLRLDSAKGRVAIVDDHGHDATVKMEAVNSVTLVDLAAEMRGRAEAQRAMLALERELFPMPVMFEGAGVAMQERAGPPRLPPMPDPSQPGARKGTFAA